MKPAPLLLLLGGSFNPPHIAHLRVALEGREALRPEKTLFIPAASPPHKPDARLLSFDMRVKMLKAAIAPLPAEWGLEVCEVENERQGPSYTIDTLAILSARYPEKRLVFSMGSEDYSQFATWRRWSEIPQFADLVVIQRKDHGEESFCRNTLSLWPEARLVRQPEPQGQPEALHKPEALRRPEALHKPEALRGEPDVQGSTDHAILFPMPPALVYALPGGGKSIFLPRPLLEISSSDIRERFLSGRSLDFLVPPGVQKIITKESKILHALWG